MRVGSKLVLVVLWALPLVGAAQQQYYGTVVSSVRLTNALDAADQGRIPIHSGDVLTAEHIRASIQALYDTGHYRYIEVDATSSPTGTVLSFIAQPHYFFSTFRLERPELLDRPLSSLFRIPLGEKYSSAVVQRISEELVGVLEDAGYFNAVITPDPQFDDRTNLVAVVLKVQAPNLRAKIRTIEVRGGEQTY